MKSFKEFLTESEKEHKMTLRFCCDIDENAEDRIEKFLGKYDLRNMSKTSKTPISKNPMFFKDVENSEVCKIDVVTGYPVSADILRQQLADQLCLHIKHVAVHPEGWEPTEEEDKDENAEPLLTSEEKSESDAGKNYGRTFIDDFLKTLTPKEMETKENELSPKEKRDPAPEQMDKEEKSSPSVISGDEK
jgi:hypothetical protein